MLGCPGELQYLLFPAHLQGLPTASCRAEGTNHMLKRRKHFPRNTKYRSPTYQDLAGQILQLDRSTSAATQSLIRNHNCPPRHAHHRLATETVQKPHNLKSGKYHRIRITTKHHGQCQWNRQQRPGLRSHQHQKLRTIIRAGRRPKRRQAR